MHMIWTSACASSNYQKLILEIECQASSSCRFKSCSPAIHGFLVCSSCCLSLCCLLAVMWLSLDFALWPQSEGHQYLLHSHGAAVCPALGNQKWAEFAAQGIETQWWLYTRVDGRIKPEKLLASFVRLSHLLNLGTDFGYKSKVVEIYTIG